MLLIFGCGENDKKEQSPIVHEKTLVQKNFGNYIIANQTLGVELNPEQFATWFDLVKRASTIICHDSIPKITLKTNDKIKIVYFQNPCLEKESYKPIKSKNIIEIKNDSVLKYPKIKFPIDSLESVLRNDINNYGKNPLLCEDPKKLVISISYDKYHKFDKLLDNLNQVTDQYFNITDKTEIKIWLTDMAFLKPPLPPNK